MCTDTGSREERAEDMDEANQPGVIDCDIHLNIAAIDVLLPFLDTYWRSYIQETSFKGPIDTSYPRGSGLDPDPTARLGGSATAADRDRLRAWMLDRDQVTTGILTSAYAIESIRNPFAAAALASAINDWQTRDWLSAEPRLRGSVIVPIQDPELAAREIDRVGTNPGFVQVLVPVHVDILYGHRHYYPIYDAATRAGLAIGIHAGGNPGNPPTAVGWPTYFVEEYVGMAHIFQSQLISLVTEGVFDRFPDLRVALIESGVTWLPSLMWRLDKEWKGLRREVPWVRRLPSEYIHDHVRLTTTPFDASRDPAQVQEIIDQIGADDLLMFASDFPHQHGGQSPTELLAGLPPELRRKIASTNAAAFYRLAQ
jgi:uncharacterized protein